MSVENNYLYDPINPGDLHRGQVLILYYFSAIKRGTSVPGWYPGIHVRSQVSGFDFDQMLLRRMERMIPRIKFNRGTFSR